jgi:hypothetical protein
MATKAPQRLPRRVARLRGEIPDGRQAFAADLLHAEGQHKFVYGILYLQRLKTLGGQRRERSRLLLVSGAILTAANFAVMLPLGLLVDYLAFKMCNEWLPAGGFVTSALMYYRISPLVIPIILFFALLCGFAPCAIEYYHVRRAMQEEDEIEGMLAAELASYANQEKEERADVSEKE